MWDEPSPIADQADSGASRRFENFRESQAIIFFIVYECVGGETKVTQMRRFYFLLSAAVQSRTTVTTVSELRAVDASENGTQRSVEG